MALPTVKLSAHSLKKEKKRKKNPPFFLLSLGKNQRWIWWEIGWDEGLYYPVEVAREGWPSVGVSECLGIPPLDERGIDLV